LPGAAGVKDEADDNAMDGLDDGALLGAVCVLAGTAISSLQFAAEEKLMSTLAVPPLLLVGMEGVTGLALTLGVAYPIYWMLPGEDHGHFEDPLNTLTQLRHSAPARTMALTYTSLVLLYNVFSMMVTQQLSSVWKAILSNCRPASVWATQLVLFGATKGRFGEAWADDSSWLQLTSLLILLVGIFVYNGAIPLPCCVAGSRHVDDDLDEASVMPFEAASPLIARGPLAARFRHSPAQQRILRSHPLMASSETLKLKLLAPSQP